MMSNKISPISEEVELSPQPLQDMQKQRKPKEDKRNRKRLFLLIFFVLCLLGIAVIVIILVIVFKEKKGKEEIIPVNTTIIPLSHHRSTDNLLSTAQLSTVSRKGCSSFNKVVKDGHYICSTQNDRCNLLCSSSADKVPADAGTFVCNKNNDTWIGNDAICIQKTLCVNPGNDPQFQKLLREASFSCKNAPSNKEGDKCTARCNDSSYIIMRPITICLENQAWTPIHSGCILKNPCKRLPENLCQKASQCVNTNPGVYGCQCPRGHAGDGKTCGLDTDFDGFPDTKLSCKSFYCQGDNCPGIANSGQEDTDSDGLGDVCDSDVDNDGSGDTGIYCGTSDDSGNENDFDGDTIRDQCDNCYRMINYNQSDTDNDGIGDVCDNDIDGDGISNDKDLCPYIPGQSNKDSDGDGVDDACDNCPFLNNPLQSDLNQNLIGDDCEQSDIDNDGIPDWKDNCPSFPNGDQVDTDRETSLLGDACDSDRDGDGISNLDDNCPWLKNEKQTDFDHDGVGDKCYLDEDGDGILNNEDDFPIDFSRNTTTFKGGYSVLLDDHRSKRPAPVWKIYDNGKEIVQNSESTPGMFIGKHHFGQLEFSGTIMIDNEGLKVSDGYAGLVFGYQSDRKFYVCSWRRTTQYDFGKNKHPIFGRKGISLKMINSTTGPGHGLREALWKTSSTANQSILLWHSTDAVWKANDAITWKIVHNPDSGRMRIILTGRSRIIADSGDIVDYTYRGGRVGVFGFEQKGIHFSAMKTKSPKIENFALLLNGVDSKIDAGDAASLIGTTKLDSDVLLSAWVNIPKGISEINCSFTKIDFGVRPHADPGPLLSNNDDETSWVYGYTTPTIETGPTEDNTPGDSDGYYAFMNSSSLLPGDRCSFLTPWFLTSPTCYVDLSVHMYSLVRRSMGRFTMSIAMAGEYGWRPLKQYSGNQGSKWFDVRLQLAGFGEKIVRLRFSATKAFGPTNDIAIDDIIFSDGCRKCLKLKTHPIFSSTGFGPSMFVKDGALYGGFGSEMCRVDGFQFGKWNYVALEYNQLGKYQKLILNWDHNETLNDRLNDRLFSGKTYVGYSEKEATKGYMEGIIDELRIWKNNTSVVDYLRQVKVWQWTEGLEHLYRFDEGEGLYAKDSTTYGDKIQVINSKWVASSLELWNNPINPSSKREKIQNHP